MEVDGEQDISLERWNLLSKDARELILKMTNIHPSDRPTISEVLSDPWITEYGNDDTPTLVYKEMAARKEYITSTYSSMSKHKASHKK